MQVTLNIDSTNMGETVVELFKNISQEKKEELAESVMKEWLKEPYKIERNVAEREVFIKMRASGDSIGYNADRIPYSAATDEQLRKEYKYSDMMKNFKSSKEEMITEIGKEAVKFYREKAGKLIETDEQLKTIFETVAATLKEDFPKFVHDAMVYWFAQQFQSVMQTAGSAIMQSQNNEAVLKQLQNRVGIY